MLEQHFSAQKTAEVLGISVATVRNWSRFQYLSPRYQSQKLFFEARQVLDLKNQIVLGEIGRLNSRANKSKKNLTFIPQEYLSSRADVSAVAEIVNFIKKEKLDFKGSLFILALKIWAKKRGFLFNDFEEIIKKIFFWQGKSFLEEELKNWAQEIDFSSEEQLFRFNFDFQGDFLGLIYQSLLSEGTKSKQGSYYTPFEIIKNIFLDYPLSSSQKFLDPCCGTGQFLLSLSKPDSDPRNFFGFDIDPLAIRIARLNLMFKYSDINFRPNIFCLDFLSSKEIKERFRDENFSLIATNPPWGFHFSREKINYFKKYQPDIFSGESFSYFLSQAIDLLPDNGISSFIFPESILNVKGHADIRAKILGETKILKIVHLGRTFKNVFSPVIRLDLQKKSCPQSKLVVSKFKQKYFINQKRFQSNKNYIFDININNTDYNLIQKAYSHPFTTLKGQADWALGIVTGNNSDYLSQKKLKNTEEIITGQEVSSYKLTPGTNYISFCPEKFQQVASEEKYRAEEKLIYKFISKNLVFAYDNQKKLTLNSANIVIPKIEGYSLKVIMALFNSSLYRFIYRKKFSSIKILRGHLEELPLPVLSIPKKRKIVTLVEAVLQDQGREENIDNYIFDIFNYTGKEKKYILNYLRL